MINNKNKENSRLPSPNRTALIACPLWIYPPLLILLLACLRQPSPTSRPQRQQGLGAPDQDSAKQVVHDAVRAKSR